MTIERKPLWLKKKIAFGEGEETRRILQECGLNTVCREARCPNISECFKRRHATFLILGKHCTRACHFCHVTKNVPPQALDAEEPQRIARAVEMMGLKHVVLTSVTRDDLADGGALHFARVIQRLQHIIPRPTIEVLVPDFQGKTDAIKTVTDSAPDIFGHNLETVERLYRLRPDADYQRSLEVLRTAKISRPDVKTKSALMLGLGETKEELLETFENLRRAGCDFLAMGQYLRPDKENAEVIAYITPERFEECKKDALALGFLHVESAPYVRSSFNAAAYLT